MGACAEPQDAHMKEVRGPSARGALYSRVLSYDFYSLGLESDAKPEFTFEMRLWR